MIWRRGFRASRRAAVAPAIPHPIIRTSVSANVSLPPVKDESQRSGFAQKVTCQQYSTASEATGWYPQLSAWIIVSWRVPPPRFARGTVLIARHSPRLEFLCKALWQWKKSAGRTFISHESSAICHIDRVPDVMTPQFAYLYLSLRHSAILWRYSAMLRCTQPG